MSPSDSSLPQTSLLRLSQVLAEEEVLRIRDRHLECPAASSWRCLPSSREKSRLQGVVTLPYGLPLPYPPPHTPHQSTSVDIRESCLLLDSWIPPFLLTLAREPGKAWGFRAESGGRRWGMSAELQRDLGEQKMSVKYLLTS